MPLHPSPSPHAGCTGACTASVAFSASKRRLGRPRPLLRDPSRAAIGWTLPAQEEAGFNGAKFLGWVGKIVGYEKKKKKMKVKIKNDRGFESLDLRSGKYAIASLVRLV